MASLSLRSEVCGSSSRRCTVECCVPNKSSMDTEDDMIESPMSIHDLPDEILVSVFAFLRPRELLGSVPVVCKRWQALARESLAWRHSNFCMWQDWRIWQRAPMLGHVHVMAANNTEEERLRTLVQLEGPRIIRSLRLVLRHPKDAVGIMCRFAHSVRVLDLQVGGQNTPDTEWIELFNAIGQLSELRSLAIRPCPTGRDIPYSGQVGRGCPHLKHLRLRGHEGVAVDLLRDLHDRLTSLSISDRFGGESGELAEALSRCRLVRELVLPTGLLGAIGGMLNLRKLLLIAELAAPSAPSGSGAAAAAAARSAAPALAALQELALVPSPRHHPNPAAPIRWRAEPDWQVNRLIGELSRHLRSLRALDIRCANICDEYLSELLNNVRELQKIELQCKIYHLQQLATLPHLRKVTACLDSRFEFVPYVRYIINELNFQSEISFDVQFCER